MMYGSWSGGTWFEKPTTSEWTVRGLDMLKSKASLSVKEFLEHREVKVLPWPPTSGVVAILYFYFTLDIAVNVFYMADMNYPESLSSNLVMIAVSLLVEAKSFER